MLLLLLVIGMLAGCNDKALKQRTEEIRIFSDREDRVFRAEALAQIEHRYWTVHDHVWYGRLQDGRIYAVRNPRAIPAPLPSRALYHGWHLQLTIVSDSWRTYPATEVKGGFAAIYEMTRYNATSWDIRVVGALPTAPLRHDDALRVEEAGFF